MDQKDELVKQLAIVNLERNQCIDRLDEEFRKTIESFVSIKRGSSASK